MEAITEEARSISKQLQGTHQHGVNFVPVPSHGHPIVTLEEYHIVPPTRIPPT